MDHALAVDAFASAIEDLIEGRLGLGGGVNRGHGWFDGEVLHADLLMLRHDVLPDEVMR